jgi:hypothetical protein
MLTLSNSRYAVVSLSLSNSEQLNRVREDSRTTSILTPVLIEIFDTSFVEIANRAVVVVNVT